MSLPDEDNMAMDTVSDNARYTHMVAPQFPNTPVLNEAMSQSIKDRAQEFWDYFSTSFDATASPDPDTVASTPALTGTWKVTAFSDSIIGVALMTNEFAGASSADEIRTFWYSTETDSNLKFEDFFTSEHVGDAKAAVRDALSQQFPDSSGFDSAAEGLSALEDGTARYGFTQDGNLLVGFDAYVVTAGSQGAPAVEIPWDTVQDWMSDAGKQARDASINPQTAAQPSPAQPAQPQPGDTDCKAVKCVALTFDDGPMPKNDERLLKILADHNARATFFMIGKQVGVYADTVAKISAAGHEIGNHSMTHASLPSLGAAQVRKELKDTDDAIESATGIRPTLVRPPYGATSSSVKKLIREEGLTQVLWTVDTLDWKHHDPKKTLAHVKNDTKNGSIILMHDIHPTTIDAVEDSIIWLQDHGYTLVTVSDLLNN